MHAQFGYICAMWEMMPLPANTEGSVEKPMRNTRTKFRLYFMNISRVLKSAPLTGQITWRIPVFN